MEELGNPPTLEELGNPPTLEELSKAIYFSLAARHRRKMASHWKFSSMRSKPFNSPLHELLCLFWEQGYIPRDMKDASIVILYKNNCNNFCGISFLTIVGKDFARVSLNRF